MAEVLEVKAAAAKDVDDEKAKNELKNAFISSDIAREKTITQKLFPNRQVDYPNLGPEISQNALIEISRVQSAHIPEGYNTDKIMYHAQDGSTNVYDILPHEPLFEIINADVLSANLNCHGQTGMQSVSSTAVVTSSFNGATAEWWSNNCRFIGYCGNQTIRAVDGPQNLVKVLMTGVVLATNNTNKKFKQNEFVGVWIPSNLANSIKQRQIVHPELPPNTFVCEFAAAAATPSPSKVVASFFQIDIRKLQKELNRLFGVYIDKDARKVNEGLNDTETKNKLFHPLRLSAAARLFVYMLRNSQKNKKKHEILISEFSAFIDSSRMSANNIQNILDKVTTTAADNNVLDENEQLTVNSIMMFLIMSTIERCAGEMRLQLQADCEPHGGQCRAFLRPPGAF